MINPQKLFLKQVREQHGFSQNALARAMDMTLQGIQHLEYSTKQIKLDTLDRLCSVLDCEISDLLVRVPSQEPIEE